MSNELNRARLHEKELTNDARLRLIDRLNRAIELVKLEAPEIIIDLHMHLVNGSVAALLGDYNLREEARQRQQRVAVGMGRCRHCFDVREDDHDEYCATCAAEFEEFSAEMEADQDTLCVTCGRPRDGLPSGRLLSGDGRGGGGDVALGGGGGVALGGGGGGCGGGGCGGGGSHH